MNKTHHPSNRAERLRLKQLKDTFDNKSSQLGRLRKRELQALKAREVENELRAEVSLTKEEA